MNWPIQSGGACAGLAAIGWTIVRFPRAALFTEAGEALHAPRAEYGVLLRACL